MRAIIMNILINFDALILFHFSVHILQAHKKKRNSTSNWTTRIPAIARAMECLLYYNASSFDEYMSISTFSQRLNGVMTGFIENASNKNKNHNVAELSNLFNSVL